MECEDQHGNSRSSDPRGTLLRGDTTLEQCVAANGPPGPQVHQLQASRQPESQSLQCWGTMKVAGREGLLIERPGKPEALSIDCLLI
jgi:hypothetical protein